MPARSQPLTMISYPLSPCIFKGSAPNHVFQRMKELIATTYMKPDQIPPRGSTNEEEDVIELELI